MTFGIFIISAAVLSIAESFAISILRQQINLFGDPVTAQAAAVWKARKEDEEATVLTKLPRPLLQLYICRKEAYSASGFGKFGRGPFVVGDLFAACRPYEWELHPGVARTV